VRVSHDEPWDTVAFVQSAGVPLDSLGQQLLLAILVVVHHPLHPKFVCE